MSGVKAGADAPARPAPMERGCYNQRSRLQAGGGAHGLPAIARAFGRMPLEGGPLTVVDYGCAQGRNSLAPMRAAITEIRARHSAGSAVSIVHTDQPDNDFATLFALLRDSEDSYLRDEPNLFASAIGRSFYEQILPAGSVTFGWCSFAIHWLSGAPVASAGHIWGRLTSGGVRRALEQRSTDDWRLFLTHRAAELSPGGCLVIVQPSLPDAELSTFPILMAWAQGELDAMTADGTLRTAEAARMTVLCYERYPADIRAPFADGDFCGLTLVEETSNALPDPFWPPYQATGDANTLADQYVGFFQAPFMPSLLAALDADRDAAFRTAFAARLETGLRDRILAEPQPLMTPLAVHVSLIQKQA